MQIRRRGFELRLVIQGQSRASSADRSRAHEGDRAGTPMG
jgi:hypothetical protein